LVPRRRARGHQGHHPKAEETFSLRTKDHREALKLVRIEAARVFIQGNKAVIT
jgi:hypothetical protein